MDIAEQIKSDMPKDPLAAIFYIEKVVRQNWPLRGNTVHALSLQQLPPDEIDGFVIAFDIAKAAHSKLGFYSDFPEGLVNPFGNDQMVVGQEVHTYITKALPLEAKKYIARQKVDPAASMFDDVEPEPTFKLDEGTKAHALELIAELRKLANESDYLDDKHRVRVLKRINNLERELYKPEGWLDTALAATREIADTVEYVDQKAKAIVDRVNEIRQITQAGSENHPQLEAPDEPKKLPAPSDD